MTPFAVDTTLFVVVLYWTSGCVDGTSSKMDFLPLADVRTDPVINPTCLSDHVHTFYGAAASLRPSTTYDELRATTENSGNVEENKSLYWHPTIYRYDPDTLTFTKSQIWFASAYYVWETGQATAFPNGFRMIATAAHPKSRVVVDCSGPSPCELPNCETENSFFPQDACGELEINFKFPSCWDGVNLDSDDHMSHVSYDTSSEGEFDGPCPQTHPVKIPEIHWYVRILHYPGGHHQFSDGTGVLHADYMSGWSEEFLQRVLDECNNYSDAANPDAWCEGPGLLTFRDAPKRSGDERIVEKLEELQPNPPLDPRATITTEDIDNVLELPRGACTGTLLGQSSDSSSTTQSPTPSQTPSEHVAPSERPRVTASDAPPSSTPTQPPTPSSSVVIPPLANTSGVKEEDDDASEVLIWTLLGGAAALVGLALFAKLRRRQSRRHPSQQKRKHVHVGVRSTQKYPV